MKLAFFDLDHTLLPLDSDYSWGVFTTTLGWTDPVEFNRRNDEYYAHYKARWIFATTFVSQLRPFGRWAL